MGRRTWTDDQLREAVATQQSWRGVLRALGLKATSGGSIGIVRGRAEVLGLDTSHFSGPRRWSDEQLIGAVAGSQSWHEVADRLGLAKQRRTELRLRGHTVRLGLDVSHLEPPPQTGQSIEELTAPPNLDELRNAAPLIVSLVLAERLSGGYPNRTSAI